LCNTERAEKTKAGKIKSERDGKLKQAGGLAGKRKNSNRAKAKEKTAGNLIMQASQTRDSLQGDQIKEGLIQRAPNGLRYPRWGGGRRSRPTGKMLRRRKRLGIAPESPASGGRVRGWRLGF